MANHDQGSANVIDCPLLIAHDVADWRSELGVVNRMQIYASGPTSLEPDWTAYLSILQHFYLGLEQAIPDERGFFILVPDSRKTDLTIIDLGGPTCFRGDLHAFG